MCPSRRNAGTSSDPPPNLTEVSPKTAKALRKHPGRSRDINDICKRQGKPGGLVPEGKAALMFEVTLITESANHKRYRVSLRSSSKRVPSNPSSNGVEVFVRTILGTLRRRSSELPGRVSLDG